MKSIINIEINERIIEASLAQLAQDPSLVDGSIRWAFMPREVKVFWKASKHIDEFTRYIDAYRHCKGVYPEGVIYAAHDDLEAWGGAFKAAEEELKRKGEAITRESVAVYLPLWSKRNFYAIDPLRSDTDTFEKYVATIYAKRVPEDINL